MTDVPKLGVYYHHKTATKYYLVFVGTDSWNKSPNPDQLLAIYFSLEKPVMRVRPVAEFVEDIEKHPKCSFPRFMYGGPLPWWLRFLIWWFPVKPPALNQLPADQPSTTPPPSQPEPESPKTKPARPAPRQTPREALNFDESYTPSGYPWVSYTVTKAKVGSVPDPIDSPGITESSRPLTPEEKQEVQGILNQAKDMTQSVMDQSQALLNRAHNFADNVRKKK